MKVFLLYPDKNFNPKIDLPQHTEQLIEDLGLKVIFEKMCNQDSFLLDITKKVFFNGEKDPDIIFYRQQILQDCIENSEIVRKIYQIPIKLKESKRRYWWGIFGSKSPENLVNEGRFTLEAVLESLIELKSISNQYSHKFKSSGFKRFFEMIDNQLDDEYINEIKWHLEKLKFEQGIILSCSLGEGNEIKDFILCKPVNKKWYEKILSRKKVYTYKLHPRDEAGAKVLENFRNMGLASIANSVASAANHVESFFNQLQIELAFYISCLNLFDFLNNLNIEMTFPKVLMPSTKKMKFEELKELSLIILKNKDIVGNCLDSENKLLYIIMGINKGGKTTFLRSIGQAILMMQAGMFVVAKNFESNLFNSLFTHFKREEDKNLKYGKFEEELVRINQIVENISKESIVLFNESFSSTNEYEGSEIAYQIATAFIENNISMFYVTHMYELAKYFIENEKVVFLEAKKDEKGEATYEIQHGSPTNTSFGFDLYIKIFENNKYLFN